VSKLRILWLTPNRKDLVCLHCYYDLEQAVAKITKSRFAGCGHSEYRRGETIDETIKRLYGNDFPDWVIVSPTSKIEGTKWLDYRIRKSKKYRVLAILSDIHRCGVWHAESPIQLSYLLNRIGFDAYAMLYTHIANCGVPEDYYLKTLKGEKFFLAPWINPEIFHPVGGEKLYDVVFLGNIDRRIYPLRWQIYNQLPSIAGQMDWKVLIRDRPKGKSSIRRFPKMLKNGYYVGEKYAETLARSRIFIFDCSIYKYPLLKFVEGMACGTLVMSDKPLCADILHFRDGENFVEIGLDDWFEKLLYYLENEDERAKIARNSYNIVMKYHTVDVRAKQLVEWLRKI